MDKALYKAITKDQLKNILGFNSISYKEKEGYVITRNTSGVLCQVSACVDIAEAQKYAECMNKNTK